MPPAIGQVSPSAAQDAGQPAGWPELSNPTVSPLDSALAPAVPAGAEPPSVVETPPTPAPVAGPWVPTANMPPSDGAATSSPPAPASPAPLTTTAGYPAAGYPPSGYPPSAYPPSAYPPSAYPPAGNPPLSYGPPARGPYAYPYATPPMWGAPPTAWPAPPPGSVVPPVRRHRVGLIVSLVTAAVLLTCTAVGIGVFLLRSFNPSAANQPVPGPALTAVATPSPTVLFQDPLTTNTNGWAVETSHCEFTHGGYFINGRICYAPAGDIQDGSVSVQVRQLSGPITWTMGIAFRRQSVGNYYAFGIYGNGQWVFYKAVNDNLTVLKPFTPSSAIHAGLNVTNRLRVVFSGTHFVFFVNDVQVGQFDDPTFTSRGLVGLEASEHIQAVFNTFEITT
ncbi:MAG TPA: hypothetical protein VIC85_14500 [Ktedonobacterales bacterium]